jgi:hypothetical protein
MKMSEVLDRLRNELVVYQPIDENEISFANDINLLMKSYDQLLADIQSLLKALEPFAEQGETLGEGYKNTDAVEMILTAEWFRSATVLLYLYRIMVIDAKR